MAKQKTSKEIVESISKEDRKELNNIKSNIQNLFGESNGSGMNLSKNSNNITKGFSNELMSKIEKNADQIDKTVGTRDHKISELKQYYKTVKKNASLVKTELESIIKDEKPISEEEQKALGALAKSLDSVMTKINDDFVAKRTAQIETIRQIEEHEEKQKGFTKNLAKGAVEQLDKAFDALAAILLPPDWYKAAKENEVEQEGPKLDKKPGDKKEIVEKEASKESIGLDNTRVELGNLKVPNVPDVSVNLPGKGFAK